MSTKNEEGAGVSPPAPDLPTENEAELNPPAPVNHPWKVAEKQRAAVQARKPDAPEPVAAAAHRYAKQGLPVFPCLNDPDNPVEHKKPLTEHGFYDATIDIELVDYWWKKWPNALIGMPTGPLTGIAVLDLDVKNGKDGLAAVPDWQTRSSVIARTQSGGVHLYFAAEGAPHCTADEIAFGVDTRGQGGYAIVPPSSGYTWLNGHDFTKLPPWPDELRPAARSVDANPGDDPEADPALVAAAMAVIPNDDLGFDESKSDWNGCMARKRRSMF